MAKLICRLPWSKGVGDSEHSDVGKGDEFTAGSECGRTFKVGAALYMVAPFRCRIPASIIDKITRKSTRHGLATVFSVPSTGKNAGTTVTLSWIQNALKDYETVDDVFDQAFLATVVFNGGGKWKPRTTPEAKVYLTKLGARDILLYSGVADLPPGPYYMTGHQMRDVWKLEVHSQNLRVCNAAEMKLLLTIRGTLALSSPFSPSTGSIQAISSRALLFHPGSCQEPAMRPFQNLLDRKKKGYPS